jgi:hypothetical protein
MKEIYALTDYNGNFGSKWKSTPYRSGYDKNLLKKYFAEYGYDLIYIPLSSVNIDRSQWVGRNVIYTSSEYAGLDYKSYIEDVVYSLELIGAQVIPKYKYLKATNNKVFMEFLQKTLVQHPLPSYGFGTLEEFEKALGAGTIPLPCVIKTSESRMSRGVECAQTKDEALTKTRSISRAIKPKAELIELLRAMKYKGYQKKSKYQGKFIVQPLIEGLDRDWKILIYWDKVFVLKRGIKKGDFRASGSGVDYKAGGDSGIPTHVLDYVYGYYKELGVPNISVDVGLGGNIPVVFEIQAVYFGTSTHWKSRDFFLKTESGFELKRKSTDQEEDYVYSIVKFLESS